MNDESKPSGEVWSSERCYIREFLNDSKWPEVSLAETRVQPGVTTELHALSVAEWYVIKSGNGVMRVGDDAPYAVGPGDTVYIPAGCEQQITNSGDGDLLFFCVCTPRFTPQVYASRE